MYNDNNSNAAKLLGIFDHRINIPANFFLVKMCEIFVLS